ncbi:MAG: hypothetical protein LC715_01395 [Gammaproteobacteria bacterium]|nr:hypothetical protein [Gammaproteobacteria bacterium]
MSHQNIVRAYAAALAGLTAASMALGCQAGDRAQPSSLSDNNQFDTATHLYNYSYTLGNPSSNTAPLDTLVIKLEPGVDVVTDFKAPPGWRALYSAEKGTVMWAATGYLDPDAEDSTGNIPPSDFALPPGGSLTGFSFKSFSPPGAGLAITQSYAPLYKPQTAEDFEAIERNKDLSTLPEDNGFRLTTIVPVPDADWTGNRRPAVDGFLVFANLQNRSSYKGSALVILRLGSAGEVVDPATLQVLLNGSDVTNMFNWSAQFNGYAATFSTGSSPVLAGTNVLRTSVEGIVPGTADRRATDTDRVTFEFIP